MKATKKVMTCFAISGLACIFGGVIPNQAEAAECPGIVEVTPTYVEDCSNTAETAGGTGTIVLKEKTKEELTYTFKFDAEYSSYAKFDLSNAVSVIYDESGVSTSPNMSVSMGESPDAMTVYGTYGYTKKQTFYEYLKKGTYYFKITLSLNDANQLSFVPGNATASLSVCQDKKNVELGSSAETAVPLTNGVYNEGVIVARQGVQYFVFTLDKKANVDYSIVMNTVWASPYYASTYSYVVGLYQFDSGIQLDEQTCYYTEGNSYSKNLTLDAGKYYIRVKDTADGDYASSHCYLRGFFKVNQYVEETPVPVPSPSVTPVPNPTPTPGNAANTATAVSVKCTKYKKNTKVVKGIATPKAKIVLTVNGKKYTTVVSNKGNFSVKLKKKLKKGNIIKVYAKLAGVKSKTVKYKVK